MPTLRELFPGSLKVIVGIALITFVITLQTAIFLGTLARSYSFITESSAGDIWVAQTQTRSIDDTRAMRSTALLRVKSVEGVAWAVPLYRGVVKAKFQNGQFENCIIVGIDEATLIGGPHKIIDATIFSLREPDAVFVEERAGIPVGTTFEIFEKRAKVVGLFKAKPSVRSDPIIYTTFSKAINYPPKERNKMNFILVKANGSIRDVKKRIQQQTGLAAYTNKEFKQLTRNYYLTKTGIFYNFSFTTILIFFFGVLILVFLFKNQPYIPLIQNILIIAMGYGIGLFFLTLFVLFFGGTELSFQFPFLLYIGLFLIIICLNLISYNRKTLDNLNC